MLRIACIAALGVAVTTAHAAAPLEHFGACDGSAAVAIGADRFLVANDDDQILRLYRGDASGAAPELLFDWSKWLELDGTEKKDEVDIEGATRIGQRIYWIGSHGLNTKAKVRPKRRQLFATDLDDKNGMVALKPFGKAYTGLFPALLALSPPDKDRYGLHKAALNAPEQDGLNIEGLAATPSGDLLIGFRSPVHDGKALIVPLQNADALLNRGRQKVDPVFGKPIELALAGKGIRSIDYVAKLRSYLIVAGPPGKGDAFNIYKWSGTASEVPVLLKLDINAGLRPESLFALPDGKRVMLLSDDGDDKIDGTICKDYKPKAKRKFRSTTITITTE